MDSFARGFLKQAGSYGTAAVDPMERRKHRRARTEKRLQDEWGNPESHENRPYTGSPPISRGYGSPSGLY